MNFRNNNVSLLFFFVSNETKIAFDYCFRRKEIKTINIEDKTKENMNIELCLVMIYKTK